MLDATAALTQEPKRALVAEPIPRADLAYCQGVYDLLLRADGPRTAQALATYGAGECALIVEDPLVLLAFRFSPCEPWNLARLRGPSRIRPDHLPPAQTEERALLAISLTDAHGTPIPPAPVRVLTLPLQFTRALHEATRHQLGMPADPRHEARARASLGRRCPTLSALVARAQARCGSLM